MLSISKLPSTHSQLNEVGASVEDTECERSSGSKDAGDSSNLASSRLWAAIMKWTSSIGSRKSRRQPSNASLATPWSLAGSLRDISRGDSNGSTKPSFLICLVFRITYFRTSFFRYLLLDQGELHLTQQHETRFLVFFSFRRAASHPLAPRPYAQSIRTNTVGQTCRLRCGVAPNCNLLRPSRYSELRCVRPFQTNHGGGGTESAASWWEFCCGCQIEYVTDVSMKVAPQ